MKEVKNIIQVFSKKHKKVICEYDLKKEVITDEMLLMAKIESVLNERPKYMTQESIDAVTKTFDEYFYLIVNDNQL